MVTLRTAPICLWLIVNLQHASGQTCIKSLSIPIDPECNVDTINVAACDVNEAAVSAIIEVVSPVNVDCRGDWPTYLVAEQEPWDFGDLGVLSDSMTSVAASCQAFFDSFCGYFEAIPREGVQCDFFCQFWDRGMRDSLDECNVQADCFGSNYGQPGTICLEEYMYAMTTSCQAVVEGDSLFFGIDEDRQAFVSKLLEFISAQSQFEDFCHAGTQPEVMTVDTIVESPNDLGDPLCYDRSDCDFACYNHGFSVNRTGGTVTMRTTYQGQCDCSYVGEFEGEIVYPSGYTMFRARNRDGVDLVAIPLRFSNEFFVLGARDGDVCIFVWQIMSGTMFGLPTSAPSSTSSAGEINLIGINAELSPGLPVFGPESLLRRRRESLEAITRSVRRGTWDHIHAVLKHTDLEPASCSKRNPQGGTALREPPGDTHQEALQLVQDAWKLISDTPLQQEDLPLVLQELEAASEDALWPQRDTHATVHDGCGAEVYGSDEPNAGRERVERLRRKARALPKTPDTPAASHRDSRLRAVGTECPLDEGDCRYACIAGGFSMEAYGPVIRLTSLYEGDQCDCKAFFIQGEYEEPGPAVLVGLVYGEDSDQPFYLFPGAIDFAYENEIIFDEPFNGTLSSFPGPPSAQPSVGPSTFPSGFPPSPSGFSPSPSGTGFSPSPSGSGSPPAPSGSGFPPSAPGSGFPPLPPSLPGSGSGSQLRRLLEWEESSPPTNNPEAAAVESLPEASPLRRYLVDECSSQGGRYYEVTHKCFRLVEIPSNFSVARTSCQQLNAELAIIQDPSENEYVRDVVFTSGGGAWLGLEITSWTSPTVYDAFYVSGEQYSLDTWGWFTGEPNNDGPCVEFSSGLSGWNDVNCDASDKFHICSAYTCPPGQEPSGAVPFGCAPCPPGTNKSTFGTYGCAAIPVTGGSGSLGGSSFPGSMPNFPGSHPSFSGSLHGPSGSQSPILPPSLPGSLSFPPSQYSAPSPSPSPASFPPSLSGFSFSMPDSPFPSGLPDLPDLAPPGERGAFPMDLVLRPFADGMILDFDGFCGYTVNVSLGQILGVGSALVTAVPLPSELPALRFSVVETGSIGLSEGCAAVEEECGYACLTSEFSGISTRGDTFLAYSADPSCECTSYTVNGAATRFEAPGWTIEPDLELNALRFAYQGEAGSCSGLFNVSEGGSFLGIPLPPGGLVDGKNESGPEPITVGQAEAAATGLTVGVATAVGAAVAGAVGGAVGGAAGGAAAGGAAGGTAGGAGGGGASGGGVPNLVFQAQFLAVSGRVGGPDGQPESSQALSEGMGWANFHLFSLGGGSDDDDEDEGARRRRGRSGRRAQKEGESMDDYACRLMRESPRELGGTAVMCIIATFVAWFFREAVCYLLHFLQRRRGMDPLPPKAAPFPSWEIQVFLMQFQGLAESTADSVASGCLAYEIGGAIVLFFLLLTLAFLMLIGIIGIITRRAKWKHIPLSVALADLKATAEEQKHKGIVSKAQGYYAAYQEVWGRGEWVQAETSHKVSETLENRFVDRYGKMFDGYHSGGWWYGFWNMFRALGLGLVLGSIFNPKTNAVLCTVLGTFDTVILVFFHPDGDWWEVIMNVYRALMNLTVVCTTLAFINDTLSLAWFSNIFQYLSIFSIIPQLVTSLFGGAISAVSAAVGAVRGCTSALPSMDDAAQGGITGAVAGVVIAAGDKEVVMESLEEMKNHGEDEEGEEADAANKKASSGGQAGKGGRWIMSEQEVSRGIVVDGHGEQPYGILPHSYPQNGAWADPSDFSYPTNVWNRDENQLLQLRSAGPQQPHHFPYEDPSNMYMGYDNGGGGGYYGPGEA